MTIRRKLQIASLVLLLTAGAIAMVISETLRRADGEVAAAGAYASIQEKGFALAILAASFGTDPAERTFGQWRDAAASMAKLLDDVEPRTRSDAFYLDSIRGRFREAKGAFDRFAWLRAEGQDESLAAQQARRTSEEVRMNLLQMTDEAKLLVSSSLARALAEEQKSTLVSLYLLGSLVLLFLGSAGLTGATLSRGLSALTRGVREVEAGNLDHRVAVKSRDELGALAAGFNRMAERLRISQGRLALQAEELRQANEELDARVRERTAALRESESLNRAIVENFSGGSLILFDEDLRFVRVGGMDLASEGVDIQGKTLREVMDAESAEFLEPYYRKALAGEPSAFEMSWAGDDYETRVAPVLDGEGRGRYGLVVSQVVTERKRAELALRESEEKFRNIFNTSSSLISITTLREGRILDVNKAFTELIGYERQEIVGKLSRDMSFWADFEERIRLAKVLEAEGRFHNAEVKLRTKNGDVRTALMSCSLMSLDGERCIVTSVIDITKRKRAEEALGESEERFRTLVEGASDAYFVHDMDGRFAEVNRMACESLGYAREELLRMTVFDVEQDFDLERAREAWSRIEPGRTLTLFGRQRRRDGSVFPVEARLSAVVMRGQRLVLGLVRDVTEREAAERERRELLERLRRQAEGLEETVEKRTRELSRMREILEEAERIAGSGSWEWNVSTDEFTFSENWLRIHGVGSERLSQADLMKLAHPEDAATVQEALREAMDGGAAYEVVHRIVRDGDGEVRIIHARGQIVSDGAGRPVYVRGWAQDITERSATDDALRRANLELQIKNKELRDFSYIASHDLQEPLRKIQVFGQKLREDYARFLGEQGQDYLRRMERSAGRMQSLIQDLLAYSSVTAAVAPLVVADLGDLAREATTDLDQKLEETGGTIEIGALPSAEVDPLQMRQVFQNIFSNALKYRGAEPPQVRASGEIVVEDGRRTARVTIQDNGIGFDEQFLDRIFEPFQRLHGKNAYEGTGIGLAIVRRIMERHNGAITARSRPGEGSAFILSLPAALRDGA